MPEAGPASDTELPVPWPEVKDSSGNMLDSASRPISKIYFLTRKFAIYEANGSVYYQLPADYQTAQDLRSRISELGGLRASIQDLRNEPSLRKSNESARAGEEVAWALSEAFETTPAAGSPASSIPKDILTRVDARLRALVKSHYRKKYVTANIVAFAAFEVALVSVAVLARSWIVVHDFAILSGAGALGALLSVLAGIRTIEIGSDVERWEHWFSGATRILIGVIGAVVVGFALDSGLLNTTLGSDKEILLTSMITGSFSAGHYSKFAALILLFGFIAGFSETLVPNVLRKGEGAASSDSKPAASDAPIVQDMKP